MLLFFKTGKAPVANEIGAFSVFYLFIPHKVRNGRKPRFVTRSRETFL
ncbi:Uncharacterized protein dnm_088650 [Desulfonema magnum]|uniref:Uncharacterized protein n=1 Tax=Desulfonema magnum TaxID=45655 RepID=A0A975GT61_9BACT|nr:Uncharacterized protein dnm_088650 [Desulfonema magnum]